jgi:hypothetical protein
MYAATGRYVLVSLKLKTTVSLIVLDTDRMMALFFFKNSSVLKTSQPYYSSTTSSTRTTVVLLLARVSGIDGSSISCITGTVTTAACSLPVRTHDSVPVQVET